MIAVPSGTKVLIFSTQRDLWLNQEDIKKMETSLTERTGIPCVVLTGFYTLLIPSVIEPQEKKLHEASMKSASSWAHRLSYGFTTLAMILSLIALIAQLMR